MQMQTGVYKIRNIINNRIYIGSTSATFARRKSDHLLLLRRNKHHSIKLQRAYNKYGENSFVFEILEYCLPEDCIKNEQKWIDLLQPHKKGYNILFIAGSCRGRICTAVHKRKISKSEKGKKVSIETRRKISLGRKGQGLGVKKGPLPLIVRNKIGAANRGKKCTLEHRRKISASLKGIKRTEEFKQNLQKCRGKKVGKFDMKTGILLENFISTAEVQRKYNYLNQGISRACLTGGYYKGYYWKYI